MRTVRYGASFILLLMMCAASALAGEVVQIKISDLAFSPGEVTIHLGDTLEWVNDDFIDHTATAQNGDWDVFIGTGKTSRLTPAHAGTSSYFCQFHPNMTGTVHVVSK